MNSQLIDAISNNDIQKVSDLIEQGVDVNFKFDDGITPLIASVIKHKPQIVQILLNAGAKTDVIGLDNKTALDIAHTIYKNFAESKDPNFSDIRACRSHLLRAGAKTANMLKPNTSTQKRQIQSLYNKASLNNKDKLNEFINTVMGSDFTSNIAKELFAASIENNWDNTLVEMIERGCKTNDLLNNSKTPLGFAVENNHSPIISLLLKHKADPTLKDSQGKTAYQTAFEHDSPFLFQEIIKLTNNNQKLLNKLEFPDDLFQKAVVQGKHNIVKCFIPENKNTTEMLLETIADYSDNDYPQQYSGKQQKAEPQTVHKGRIKIAQHLIKKGIDSSYKDADGNSLLMIAFKNGHKELLTDFINAGVNVNKKNKYGITPLMLRIGLGRDRIEQDIEKLLTVGADINAESRRGDSAIFLAAEYGDIDLVKFLYQKGAKTQTSKKSFETFTQTLLTCCSDENYKDAYNFIATHKKQQLENQKKERIEQRKNNYRKAISSIKNVAHFVLKRLTGRN